MLYILPPPSAKPPSVWDLIINFHRKGCQESNSGSSKTLSSSKKSLKFDCRETTTKKSQRTWCKTSPSDQSHVSAREIILVTSKTNQFHFLARDMKTRRAMGLKRHFPLFFKLFHPKRDFFSFSFLGDVVFDCCGKWKPFDVFTHMAELRSMLVNLKIVFLISSSPFYWENCEAAAAREIFVADFWENS